MFSPSKAVLFGAALVAAILVNIALIPFGLPREIALAFAALQLLLAGLLIASLVATRRFLNHVQAVCAAIAAGDFEHRVELSGQSDDLLATGNRINAVIDINDAFVREAGLAMKAASEGRYHRKIRPEGMRGAYALGVAKVNQAIERLSDRPALMRELQNSFGHVVEAAVAGDLSYRVEAKFPDPELNALARSVNRFVETVDRGINETGAVLSALAHADLRHRVEGEYQGAFLRLKDDTNAVGDKLASVVNQLRGTSRSVRTATGEILEGMNDLADRTTRQASMIERTSTTMRQLAGTVSANAALAQSANEKALAVRGKAESGRLVMQNATEAMERISGSSAMISKIVAMMDDIAFQTNLLALNASVEAARAGDAGKGFAVVAVEVRRLAQSSAQAAQDVKNLVEQSVSEVGAGSSLVLEAAGSLTAMLDLVRENSDMLTDISRSSRDQAEAIDDASAAVIEMDEMTHHNAALVEETNAAIEQTNARAHDLEALIEVFSLGEGSASERSRAA